MKIEKIVSFVGLLFLAAVVTALVWATREQPGLSPGTEQGVSETLEYPPFPSPNGYGILLQAADNTKKLDKDVKAMSRGALVAYVSSHEEALKIARSAFEFDSRVILDGESEFTDRQTEELDGFGRLGTLFTAQALLAESKVQVNVAFDAYIELIKIATVVSRGGVAENLNAGSALNEKGCLGVESLIRKLSKDSIRAAIEKIGEINQQRPGPDELREWGLFLDQTLHEGRMATLDQGQLDEKRRDLDVAIESAIMQLKRLRVVLVRLALRSFEFQNGKQPESLSLLIPEYLPHIPTEPSTGALFTLADLE
ncbi:hypothetical protein N8737_00595 [Verrucomicrobia bacterium]|jgi:hypothetical protein|nr:hypothetical protein [Verrucomicrobiota bacterium]MDA7657175.1 hypothetical protein [Verrucomicrobiota bacterium]